MTDTFRRACLIAAVVIGCAFSAFQILHDVRVPVQLLPGVAARVNGRQIDMDSITRTVAGMDARERRSESATRRDVLSRMIDEELLIQHALDSGAAATSPEVRAALVRSAITRVNAEAAAEPITDGELSNYFDAHRQVYSTAARFDVTPFYFESKDPRAAQAHAMAARAAIQASTPVEQVFNTTDTPPFGSPGQQITVRTLANYFGPATATAVDHLAPGQTTDSTQLGSGVVFIYLNHKIPSEVPNLASIRELVAADAIRDRQERTLEALLASLRQGARIEFAASPNAASPNAAAPSATALAAATPNAAAPSATALAAATPNAATPNAAAAAPDADSPPTGPGDTPPPVTASR
jgi:hypothetical protein